MTSPIRKFFIASFLTKLTLALILPITLDEYYYFLWGQFPSLSYFDHPPFVGWLMILSQPLGNFAEGMMRWPSLLLSQTTIYIWLILLKPYLNQARRFWFLAIATFNPLWGLGVFITTPDIPLVFFWSISLLFLQRVLTKPSIQDYILLGAFLGCGFLSKYQIVLFVPCTLFLLVNQQYRKLLLSPKILLTIMTGLVFCLPVIIWNYHNDWASFAFQWKHGMQGSNWGFKQSLEYIATQCFLIFPTFFVFVLVNYQEAKKHWLFPFAFFPFAFFLYSSLKSRVEGNWVIMSFPSVYALATMLTPNSIFHLIKKTVYLWVILFVVVLMTLPFADHLPLKKTKLFEAKKYSHILERVQPETHYFANSYQLASYLSFKKNRLICKFPKYGRVDHYNYISQCQKLPKAFTYITKKDDISPVHIDFPEYKVVAIQFIGSDYKFIEIVKK